MRLISRCPMGWTVTVTLSNVKNGEKTTSDYEMLGPLNPRNRLTTRHKFAIIIVCKENSKSLEANKMTTCVMLGEKDNNLRYSISYLRSTE